MNARTASAKPGQIELLASNRYYDPHLACEAVKLLPGEYYVGSGDMVLVTALGACVAACIRDRKSGIGGMNHFMLGDDGLGQHFLPPAGRAARYGTHVMEVLINDLLRKGARRANLEAKVFGGGSAAVQQAAHPAHSGAGRRNARFVVDFLRTEGLPVVARDVLGNYPRKVYFFPDSGRVLVKKMLRQHNDTLLRRERSYAARLSHEPLSGEIDLFACP
jgi:chemotaxis protein CheD